MSRAYRPVVPSATSRSGSAASWIWTGERDAATILEAVHKQLAEATLASVDYAELRDPERRLLTRRAYERIGGVTGALARHAEATVEAGGVTEGLGRLLRSRPAPGCRPTEGPWPCAFVSKAPQRFQMNWRHIRKDSSSELRRSVQKSPGMICG